MDVLVTHAAYMHAMGAFNRGWPPAIQKVRCSETSPKVRY